MTKFKTRIASLLLALAVAVTMMSGMTLSAFAEEEGQPEGIQVVFNDGVEGVEPEVVGYITDEMIQENMLLDDDGTPLVQIFGWAAKGKAGAVSYKLIKGADLEAVLASQDLAYDGMLEGAEIHVCEKMTDTRHNKGFSLPVEQLKEANYVMKGQWDAANNKDGRSFVKISGGKATVIPVIATEECTETFTTYAAALEALDREDLTWKKVSYPMIGHAGIPYEGYNPDNKQIDNPAADCNAKYAITDFKKLNILSAEDASEINADVEALTFTSLKPYDISWEVTPASATIRNEVVIKSADSKIAAIDGSLIVPKGIGTTKVTLQCGSATTEVSVTVKESAFKPAKPSKISVSNVKTKSAKVRWAKVSSATGYEVYRKIKGGKYKKVKTVTKNSTVSYKNTKLKKGKTYYFKVRAYRTVSGKKVYGSFTAAKSVKIKK